MHEYRPRQRTEPGHTKLGELLPARAGFVRHHAPRNIGVTERQRYQEMRNPDAMSYLLS